MNTNTYTKLEFIAIREALADYAKSEEAKKAFHELEPMLNPNAIEAALDEAEDGLYLAENGFRVPVHSLSGVRAAMKMLSKEAVLTPHAFQDLNAFLEHAARMKRFMLEKESFLKRIGSYAYGIEPLEELTDQISGAIENGQVADRASSKLMKIRKTLGRTEAKIRERMDRYLASPEMAKYLQDDRYRIIDGKFALPVKRTQKNAVDGMLVGHSSKGTTAYVQPEAVLRLQEELETLRADEKAEEYRILSVLTGQVAGHTLEINQNMDIMIKYDIILAKGRHGRRIKGNRPAFNRKGIIRLDAVRHPLLGEEAVPLNIEVGSEYRSLIITGPNTGGKTVALKTTGICALMAVCGLLIPAAADSTLPLFEDILVDIGDNQNLEQSLSTFSAHIENIIGIVKYARKGTLVLLDEIGTGTDPVEGTGLGIAILEKLHEQGATVMATTHFSEIKTFAKTHEGFQTGSMAFDVESLKPLYRLDIGKPGESNAFLIALRLGLNYQLIERAHQASYGEKKAYRDIAVKLEKTKEKMENQKDQATEDGYNAGSERTKVSAKTLRKQLKVSHKKLDEPEFQVGDAVKISGLPAVGIVSDAPDRKGEYQVMYKNKKIKVSHKRLEKYLDKEVLYPEEYDMDIVTKSKVRRKKETKLRKGHKDVVLDDSE